MSEKPEALEKIATVNAMDYEYVRWAKAALRGRTDGTPPGL